MPWMDMSGSKSCGVASLDRAAISGKMGDHRGPLLVSIDVPDNQVSPLSGVGVGITTLPSIS
jgi:hypothetical protein